MNTRYNVIFFFFYWSGIHRDLHSFPTRRSSDLRGMSDTESRVHLPVVGPTVDAAPRRRHPPWIRDRKSTRLNSSHRCISYAVFCLKKKKKTTQSSQPDDDHERPSIARSIYFILA